MEFVNSVGSMENLRKQQEPAALLHFRIIWPPGKPIHHNNNTILECNLFVRLNNVFEQIQLFQAPEFQAPPTEWRHVLKKIKHPIYCTKLQYSPQHIDTVWRFRCHPTHGIYAMLVSMLCRDWFLVHLLQQGKSVIQKVEWSNLGTIVSLWR